MAESPPKLRILCLHGARQDNEVFSHRLQHLRKRCQPWVEFEYAESPHTMPLQEGQDLAMRAWWGLDKRKGTGGDWSVSRGAIDAAWGRGFHGVLGFSQGASAAACMAFEKAEDPSLWPGLRFCIIISGTADHLPETFLKGPPSGKVALPSLHIIGGADDIVLPNDSRKLASWFDSPTIYNHPLGHVVPKKGEDVRAFTTFFAARLEERLLCPLAPLAVGYGEDGSAQQEEEWDMLEAVMPDEVTEVPVGEWNSRKGGRELPLRTGELVRLFQVELFPNDDRVQSPEGRDSSGEDIPTYLRVGWGRGYPFCPPHLELVSGDGGAGLRNTWWYFSLLNVVREAFASACPDWESGEGELGEGGVMIFDIVTAVREWMDTELVLKASALRAPPPPADANDGEDSEEDDEVELNTAAWAEDEKEEVRAAMIAEATKEAQMVPGNLDHLGSTDTRQWSFVVGLVGKPSAGKSTLFNAVTNPATEAQAAKVASYPFTTIDPNSGHGYFSTECPCASPVVRARRGKEGRCDSMFGHTQDGRRLLPLTIKDVAGLVPGACNGRGKGNKFLDDLNDADALIHVVDSTGLSDSEGVAGCGGDPAEDVVWVQREIHCWVYQNLRNKWRMICKKPPKFYQMFTGYHAREWMVRAALQNAGLDPDLKREGPNSILLWGPTTLHKVVAHFLRLRFPILLALNKCDVASSGANIARIREKFPHTPCVALSADSESYLLQQARLGHLQYGPGHLEPSLKEGAPAQVTERLAAIRSAVLDKYGGTGVAEAVRAAVGMRQPVFAYPVGNLSSFCPNPRAVIPTQDPWSGSSKRPVNLDDLPPPPGVEVLKEDGFLRECVPMKRGSTVADLFDIVKHPPFCILEGEYVRGEGLPLDTQDPKADARLVRKDTPLSSLEMGILRIMTNKKSSRRHTTAPPQGE